MKVRFIQSITKQEDSMSSAYKVIDVIGTSEKSWEDASKTAVDTAAKSVKDLRIAEVEKLDMKFEDNVLLYRARLKLSFKYQD
jgi:hypothetical protein